MHLPPALEARILISPQTFSKLLVTYVVSWSIHFSTIHLFIYCLIIYFSFNILESFGHICLYLVFPAAKSGTGRVFVVGELYRKILPLAHLGGQLKWRKMLLNSQGEELCTFYNCSPSTKLSLCGWLNKRKLAIWKSGPFLLSWGKRRNYWTSTEEKTFSELFGLYYIAGCDPCTRSLQQLHYIHQVDDISVSTIYSEVKVGRLQLRANIVIFPAEENRPICRREFVLRNFISSHFFWYFEPRPIQAKKEQFHWSVRNSIMRLTMEVKFSIKSHLKLWTNKLRFWHK